jgi:hypothetical protein
MQRSLAAAAICVSMAAIAPAQDWDQEWRMRRTDDPSKVHFSVERSRRGSRSNHSSDIPVSAFRGLSTDALSRGGPAKFELVRDAGRIVCNGQFTNGRGIGTFQFIPDANYSSQLRSLGYGAPEEKDLFTMALTDVSLDFARGVKSVDAAANTSQLIAMRIHGITLDYMQRMRATGFSNLTANNYVEMKIHGVTPELVGELKNAGYDVPAQKVVEMKIHGATPEYIRGIHASGLKPTAQEIVEMRIHGVTPELLAEVKKAGFDMPGRKIVEMKIHGATPDYIREVHAFGLKPTADEIIQMRIHGVDAAYLRKLKDSGFKNLTPDKIVKLRIHGID